MGYILGLLLGYVIGATPIVYQMAKSRGIDLRSVGTGNVGTSNAYRHTGKSIGALAIITDMGKGFLPPLCMSMLGFGPAVQLASAIGAVMGQMWPATSKFHGGRGNATAAGACLFFDQASFLIALVFFLSTTFSKVYKILKSNNSDSSPRSKVVPIVVILAFALYGLLSFNQGLGIASVGSVFFIGLILVRRLTAPWPPDPITGDLPQKSILRILILDRPN
jgi:glycerol-3-phosphate acyltransferase PlsY|tara:strand:+ start:3393 stop:4055 length:663 start_codon:yes stop_codon:yes gene_type:complete